MQLLRAQLQQAEAAEDFSEAEALSPDLDEQVQALQQLEQAWGWEARAVAGRAGGVDGGLQQQRDDVGSGSSVQVPLPARQDPRPPLQQQQQRVVVVASGGLEVDGPQQQVVCAGEPGGARLSPRRSVESLLLSQMQRRLSQEGGATQMQRRLSQEGGATPPSGPASPATAHAPASKPGSGYAMSSATAVRESPTAVAAAQRWPQNGSSAFPGGTSARGGVGGSSMHVDGSGMHVGGSSMHVDGSGMHVYDNVLALEQEQGKGPGGRFGGRGGEGAGGSEGGGCSGRYGEGDEPPGCSSYMNPLALAGQQEEEEGEGGQSQMGRQQEDAARLHEVPAYFGVGGSLPPSPAPSPGLGSSLSLSPTTRGGLSSPISHSPPTLEAGGLVQFVQPDVQPDDTSRGSHVVEQEGVGGGHADDAEGGGEGLVVASAGGGELAGSPHTHVGEMQAEPSQSTSR